MAAFISNVRKDAQKVISLIPLGVLRGTMRISNKVYPNREPVPFLPPPHPPPPLTKKTDSFFLLVSLAGTRKSGNATTPRAIFLLALANHGGSFAYSLVFVRTTHVEHEATRDMHACVSLSCSVPSFLLARRFLGQRNSHSVTKPE